VLCTACSRRFRLHASRDTCAPARRPVAPKGYSKATRALLKNSNLQNQSCLG